ncbi:MAG TPA: translocation/assembly module TamB domain-containing protein [Dongiaceae bacterium]|nr:translocation/assembly module TamB domain-containing protein [Dongiaceae bacterium]
MKRRYRIAIYVALSVVGLLLALVAALFGVLQTGYARDQLRQQIATATAGNSTAVELDAIEGLVPLDMQLVGLRLSDRDGTWLTADRVSLSWSPSALLAGRLQVDALTAGTIDVARAPAAEQAKKPEEPGPLIPELPIAIDLRRLSVERVALAAPILGEPAALSLEAQAQLGEIADGLAASLTVRQLEGNTGTADIDVAYHPDDDFMKLNADVAEPQGGVLGRLLGLPQRSDLRITLKGEGPLDAWQGQMASTFDGRPLVDLTAEIAGRDARTIAFSLRAAPDPLLPENVRPLIAGGVDAKGTLGIKPGGGTVQVTEFSARSAAGTVIASGVLGLSEPGDLAATVTVAESGIFATLVPDVTWSGATLQARLQGTVNAPHVTAGLTAQNLTAAEFRVGTGKLNLDAAAEQGFDQPVAIRADLALSAVASRDPRLETLLTDGIRLEVAGSLDQAGTLVADRLDLQARGLALSGSARAKNWGAKARAADATLTIADLAAVGAPFGFNGKGAADFALKLDTERLELTGNTRDLSLGQPIVDRLLGSSPTLLLKLAGSVPDAMTIETAQVAGAKARLDAHGTVTDRNLDLGFSARVDDAAALDPAVHGGAVTVDGTVSGTMDAPAMVAQLNAPSLRVADRVIEHLKLSTEATDLLASPKIALDGAATVDRLPATVATAVAIEGDRIAARNLVATLGKSKVAGDVAMTNGLLTGRLALDAPALQEIEPLAGVPLAGELSADITLDAAKGRQSAQLSAKGQRIVASEAFRTASLDAAATADDLFGEPAVSADIKLADPVIADQALTQASLAAKGPLTALQTTLSVTGQELAAATEAEIAQVAQGYRVTVGSLTAGVRGIKLKSRKPALIVIENNTTRIENVDLAVEDGTLQLNGSIAPDAMELAATIDSLPLSLARAVTPDLRITGRLNGEVALSGTMAAPSGRFALTGTSIGASDVPEQQADLDVAGTLAQGRLDVKGAVKPKSGGELAFTAAVPSLSADGQLEARANGTFDLSLVDAFLAGGADRVKGKAELDVAAAGQLSAPHVTGRVRLINAGYDNLRYGIKLRKIEADVRADGPAIQIASLTATTPGGGHLSGQGTVNLAHGVDTDLKIQARNATVIDTDLATAVIDSDLAIVGNLQTELKLGGKVTVVKADIRVPDNLPPSVQEIEVVEVNAPPQVAARIAERKPPPKQTAIVDLDIAVDAPQQIWVRGRGLDVELGGAIHVGGTTQTPEVDGGFHLRRGSLDIVGKRLDFKEGQLTFEGGEQIDPYLDLTAETRAEDITVTAKVEGPARAPRIALSSVPDMPEDEILARLLFGKSAGALSPFELLQLAQATADLAGVNTGPGVLDRIRRSTGLDRLSLQETDPEAGPSLSAGRYVSDRVYVGVSQGAKSASSAATVEIEVTPNVKVESEVGAGGTGKAGINLEWDY